MVIRFNVSVNKETITSNGVVLSCPVYFKGNADYELTDDLNSNNGLYMESGTLDANGWNITTGFLQATNSTPFGTALDMGNGVWSVTQSSDAWDISDAVYILPGLSYLNFTDTSNAAITFTGGNKTYYDVNFDRGLSTGNINIEDSNQAYRIEDNGLAAHSLIFEVGTTQTVSLFDVSGELTYFITLDSSDSHNVFYLVKDMAGVVDDNYLNIQHSVAIPGTNTWYAGGGSVNNQGIHVYGSGWIFTGANIRQVNRSIVSNGIYNAIINMNNLSTVIKQQP